MHLIYIGAMNLKKWEALDISPKQYFYLKNKFLILHEHEYKEGSINELIRKGYSIAAIELITREAQIMLGVINLFSRDTKKALKNSDKWFIEKAKIVLDGKPSCRT